VKQSDHKITYQQDTKYVHLFRPVCFCGWKRGSFVGKDLAEHWGSEHLHETKAQQGNRR